MYLRHILTFSYLILLMGCIAGPNFHPPKLPHLHGYTYKPLTQPDEKQHIVERRNIPSEWWFLFHSPELNQLMMIAIRNNPDLATAQETLLQTQENANAQIGSILFPNITANFAPQRQRFSPDTFGASNAQVSVFNFISATTNFTYSFDLLGGKLREIEALKAQVEYQRFQLEGAYLILTANIVTTAITMGALEDQINETKKLISAQQKTLNIMKKQFKLGGVSGADVLAQETQVAQSRATLPPLLQSLAQAEHTMAILTGHFPSEIRMPRFTLSQFCLPRELPLSIPSELLQQRPDIRAQQALLHASSAQIGVATANIFPQFTITGFMGYQNNAINRLFLENSQVWDIAGQAVQTIFDGGALLANRRAAIANYHAVYQTYRTTALRAFKNVADVLRALENDAREVNAQRHAEISAEKTLRITQKQYRLGGVSYLSLLNAQRQYQQTKINRIVAQASRYTDTVILFQALGGGWWTRPFSITITDSNPKSMMSFVAGHYVKVPQ